MAGVAAVKFRLDPSARAMGRALGEAGREFSDFKPVFREILPHLVGGIARNFDERGAPIGKPWKQLSPSRLRQKKKAGLPLDALVAEGNLRAELQSVQKMRRALTKTRVVVGPKSALAYIHHFGGGRSNLPERAFIALSSSMRSVSLRLLRSYNDDRVKEVQAKLRAVGGSDS